MLLSHLKSLTNIAQSLINALPKKNSCYINALPVHCVQMRYCSKSHQYIAESSINILQILSTKSHQCTTNTAQRHIDILSKVTSLLNKNLFYTQSHPNILQILLLLIIKYCSKTLQYSTNTVIYCSKTHKYARNTDQCNFNASQILLKSYRFYNTTQSEIKKYIQSIRSYVNIAYTVMSN